MADLRKVLDRGIASVTVKSSSFLETSKYSNQIHIAEENISKQKTLLAEAVYAAWKEGQPLEEILDETCGEIRNLEDQIDQLRQKIVDVKNASRQMLGETAPVEEPLVFCPACGTQNKANANFCYKCGGKMH